MQLDRISSSRTLFIDVSDLLHFLAEVGHVTGIQRVQAALMVRALGDTPQASILSDHAKVVPICVHGPWGTGIRSLAAKGLVELIKALEKRDLPLSEVTAVIDSLLESAKEVEPQTGDTVLITGAFWGSYAYIGIVERLASARVLVACIVYDIIPVEAPEYCVQQLTDQFGLILNRISDFTSVFFCISDYTAKSLTSYLSDRNLLEGSKVAVFKLAHQVDIEADELQGMSPRVSGLLRRIGTNGYAICVGTLEARKNLRYLSDVWQALRIKYPGKVPHLLLVGRPGWAVSDTLAIIEHRNIPQKYVHIQHGFSDAEVAALYRESQFAVYPSLLEGWGLPVGEALAHGKVCITSDASSIPEVGGTFADYIDPLNVRSGVDVIGRYIADPTLLKARETDIKAGFEPRSWNETFNVFAEELRPIVINPTAYIRRNLGSRRYVLIPDGRNHRVGIDVEGKVSPGHDILLKGWHAAEPWGAWADCAAPRVGFKVDDPLVQEVHVDLALSVPEWLAGMKIDITSQEDDLNIVGTAVLHNAMQWFRVAVPVINGIVELVLRTDTIIVPRHIEDKRALGLGIHEVAWFYLTDYDSKLKALEIRLLGSQFYQGGDL